MLEVQEETLRAYSLREALTLCLVLPIATSPDAHDRDKKSPLVALGKRVEKQALYNRPEASA